MGGGIETHPMDICYSWGDNELNHKGAKNEIRLFFLEM